MDALKKFISKKKADVKFKTAGPGHKLSAETEQQGSSSKGKASGGGGGRGHHQGQAKPASVAPSEEKRQAAAAALARLEKQRKPDDDEKRRLATRQMAFVREQARKEIEAELRQQELGQAPPTSSFGARSEADTGVEKVIDPANYAVAGVYFTCPLIGPEVSTKEDIEERIKEFLREQPEEEIAITSCLMIHSCNKPRDKVNTCVEILCKYIDNIIASPDNPKVRKIRFANKAYQEKVAVVEGATHFLRGAGFEQERIKNEDTGEDEDFWVFHPSDPLEESISHITELRDTLKQTTPIKPELDRNLQVLMPGEVKQRRELPPEFYQLSAEEIKREQRLKTEALERELTLRTKAQREKDELREQRMYRYCVMRVRFPEGFVLQGTFWAHEKLSDLYDFVSQNLVDDFQFSLKIPRGESLQSSNEITLSESKLPPASIVQFLPENASASSGDTFLKPELLALVKSLE